MLKVLWYFNNRYVIALLIIYTKISIVKYFRIIDKITPYFPIYANIISRETIAKFFSTWKYSQSRPPVYRESRDTRVLRDFLERDDEVGEERVGDVYIYIYIFPTGVLACLARTRRLSDTVPSAMGRPYCASHGYTLRQPIYPPTYLI